MKNLFVLLTLLVVCAGSASGTVCYFCANCPYPFNPYSQYVTTQISSTGFCAKKSTSSYPGALASRGPAEPGLCYYSGCRWIGQIYTCCCRSNYCNTGSMTSKSTITVLLGALGLLAVNRFISN